MADFFSNLLLRSSAPTSGAILQPRLPSLFEPAHGVDELPAPMADNSLQESALPVAHEKDSARDETSIQPMEHQAVVIAKQAAKQTSVPKPEKTVSALSQRESVFSAEPARKTDRPPAQAESGPAPRAGKSEFSAQTVTGRLLKSPDESPRQIPSNIVKNSSNPTEAETESIGQTAIAPSEPIFKPVFTPQPVAASRRSPAPTTQPPERENVVKVHIGRIEVRAITPPAAPQPAQTPRPQAKMSLDDYLRQRGEEKR